MKQTPALSAREVYQILKDVALGVHSMRNTSEQSWSEVHCGKVPLDIDGWKITLYNNCGSLDYCDACLSPEGRAGSFEEWGRFGTEPTQLLSRWEREQLEKKLQAL